MIQLLARTGVPRAGRRVSPGARAARRRRRPRARAPRQAATSSGRIGLITTSPMSPDPSEPHRHGRMSGMRVVFAPDKFAGTLSAVEAAAAMAQGWARRAPDDELVQVPMSDGGPGFVDVLHAALGGELHAVTVTGPYGEPTPAAVLQRGRHGVRRVRPGGRAAPRRAGATGTPSGRSTVGLGELLDAGGRDGRHEDRRRARRVGHQRRRRGDARRARRDRGGRPLDAGPAGLAELTEVDLADGRRSGSPGIELVMATDVDNPLLGINGATKIYGPAEGPARRAPRHRRRLAAAVRRADRPQARRPEGRRARPAASGSR